MKRKLLLIICWFSISSVYAATTIIPTDNSQQNLRDAYRKVLSRAANPWIKEGSVDQWLTVSERPYYGEVPVYWSMDSTQYPGSFIIPDTLNSSGITTYQAAFPSMTRALSLSFNNNDVSIWVLKCRSADTTKTVTSWEYIYFEQFLVNVLDLQAGAHFQMVGSSEFVDSVYNSQLFDFSPGSAKILIVPAFIQGETDAGQYMDDALQNEPQLASALQYFLQSGGTVYCEGNAAYLLEAASILPENTVDFSNTIDGLGTDMLAEVKTALGTIPPGYSNKLYTTQAPTINDSLHVAVRFVTAGHQEDVGKPAILIYEEPAIFGNGRIILNVGMPAVGDFVLENNPQWQWVANAILLAFSERMDVVRSIYVATDSLHPEPGSLPVGVETTFEVTIQVHKLWDKSSGEIQLEEHYKPYFDYVDVVTGPAPVVDDVNKTLTFNLMGVEPQSAEIITYRLKAPALGDARVDEIDSYLDDELSMRVSELRASLGDPVFNDKIRILTRADLWARFLFEARIVADMDVNWKNILGHFFQPFKIFTIMENKERTQAVNTQVVNYAALDVPVYKTTEPLIPIERTPPGQFMDLLQLGSDLDGDAANDGPDVDFKLESIFPNAASVETVLVNWKNPWTDEYDDFDYDGIVPTDNDSDGIVDPGYDGDKLRALKIVWKPGLGTETEGTVPGYQFYDPYCYWEIWIDPPDEVQMAIGAAIRDTVSFAVTDSIKNFPSFYYDNWERWMEHDSTGNLLITRLIKRQNEDYEGFSMVDSSYQLRPTDIDYGWIPKPVRSSVFFFALGGRGPTMTNPLTQESPLSTITYETVWGHEKEMPLRSPYTYYAPLPNPLQFEYISKTYNVTDPRTGQTIDELPANRKANLTFDISVSTEYSLYWITAMTPDTDGDSLGDGVYSYVIEQIPKGLGGYSIDLPRDFNGQIDTFAVADPPPTAIWETPFYWQVYWDSLRIPAALDDDNGDGIDDWLDDTGDRFFNETDSAYLKDNFPSGHGEWLPGPDGEYGDDLVEALGIKTLKVHAVFNGNGREGLLKINDGAWLVNEEIFGGPPWVQFSHVQQAWAVGHNIQVSGKPDPVFVDIHAQTVFEKFSVSDQGEPHNFDVLFDPWLKVYGGEEHCAATYLGLMDPAHQIDPDIEMPARLNRDNVQSITMFPGVDPAEFPGCPKEGDGLFVEAVVELDNIGKIEAVRDNFGNEIGYCAKTHWYDVTVQPELSGLGNSEIFGSYCAYPRPLVPDDDFRTLHVGWRFNPSPEEILVKMGNSDGSATIPEILSTRRGYFIFLLKIDQTLANGCYRIPFSMNGTGRSYNDSTGGTPLDITIPEAKFSMSSGSTQSFVIGEAEITDIRDSFKDYVTIEDVRWTTGSEPADSTGFEQLTTVGNYQQDSTLVITSPVPKFPAATGTPDADFWLVSRSTVDVPDAGENIHLDTGLQFTYQDHFGLDSTIVIPPITVSARGVDVLVNKILVNVNEEPVQSGAFLLKEGQNSLDVSLQLHCIGTDLARTPTVTQILGELMELQKSSDPQPVITTLSNTNKLLEWEKLPDMIPGSRRRIDLTLGLSYVEIAGKTSILICDTTTAQYLNYTSYALNKISYSLDLAIDPQNGLTISPENPNPGETVTLSAAIHREGTAIAKNVAVRFFTTDPTDPQYSIGDLTLADFSGQDTTITFPWTIPADDQQLFDFYVFVDADSTIGELSEKNNIAHLVVSASEALFIDQLVNYPNPFQKDTEFTFILSQPATIKVKIYSIEGRLIRTIDYGTSEIGYNSLLWDGLDADGDILPNGTYIYKMIAKNANKTVERREYIVKMR